MWGSFTPFTHFHFYLTMSTEEKPTIEMQVTVTVEKKEEPKQKMQVTSEKKEKDSKHEKALDEAAVNYRFTKKSAFGMILVAFAAVFGRLCIFHSY